MGERDNEHIVEVANVQSRFEADAIVALLADNGIKAIVDYGDVGGWAPNLASVGGNSVQVFESDLDAARGVLESDVIDEG